MESNLSGPSGLSGRPTLTSSASPASALGAQPPLSRPAASPAPVLSSGVAPAPAAPPAPRVCVIYAYPSLAAGHGPRILAAVLDTLRAGGVTPALIDLYRERFEAVMGEEEVAQYGRNLHPDVQNHQAKLSAADAWIFLYPSWWSAPPAILKGWIDRVLTPGFAYRQDSKGMLPLLSGKRALVVRTFSAPALYEEKAGHVSQNFMDKAVLAACGLKAVAVDIYSIDALAESAFAHALFQVQGAVRRVLVTPSSVPHHLRSISAPYLPPLQQKPKLPVEADGEEKIELSEEAQADLDYFRSARRKAREAVHQRADARQGKPGQSKWKGRSGSGSRGFSGRARGGASFTGRSSGGRGRDFNQMFGPSAGGSSPNRGGRNSGSYNPDRDSSGSFGGRSTQGGGRFFGRKQQENRREGGSGGSRQGGFGGSNQGQNQGRPGQRRHKQRRR